MMERVHWSPLSLIWVLAFGCAAGSTPAVRSDSGPDEIDAGADEIDAAATDASIPRDANMPDAEAAPLDVGVDGNEGCGPPPLSLMSSQLPRCSAATSDCIDGCTTGACQTACLDADTTPPVNIDGRLIDCRDCLNVQSTDCAVAAGCQAEWDAFRCCEAACGDLACAGECQNTHRAALTTCYQMFAPSCQGALLECFPAE